LGLIILIIVVLFAMRKEIKFPSSPPPVDDGNIYFLLTNINKL